MTGATDLVIYNGNLITLESEQPRATAMAVRDGRIVFVGDDRTAISLARTDARRIDLAGATVTPGFCDAHIHFVTYGLMLLKQADLVGCASVIEVLERMSDLAHRTEGWLIGHGFDQDKLAERRFPTRQELDSIFPTRPILISRICGHAAVVNSAALARVTDAERRAGDADVGLYTETDIDPFYRDVPPPSETELEQAVLAAADVALRTGITSIHTLLDAPGQMVGLSRLHAAGRLPLRVTAMPPYAEVASLHPHGIRSGFGDETLRFGAAKLFSDGSLGAQTALLAEPYADKPDTRGIRIYDPADLKRKCADAQAKGFQLAIHAIGDQAMRETLDAIEFALQGEDNAHHRHRIEHCSLTPPDCLERMARRKILGILQPQFVRSDSWTPQRIGPKRVPWAYPFKSMLKAGIPIALSSDCPVEKLDAFACLAAAVGRDAWTPDEVLTPEEALRAYCLGGAYAAHSESYGGSLKVGKVADFVVLSGDLTRMNAQQIAELRAERVFVGGIEREQVVAKS